MSVLAEKSTMQFNPTLGSSHEDLWKNREQAGGFYQMEGIWIEGVNPHSSNPSQVLRLLVFSAKRSAAVSDEELCYLAIPHGSATGATARLEARDTEEYRREDHGMTKAPSNLRRFLSIEETAEYTGLSRHTLYTMVSQRRIPFVKMGRLTKFDVTLLDAWIKQHTVMPMLRKTG